MKEVLIIFRTGTWKEKGRGRAGVRSVEYVRYLPSFRHSGASVTTTQYTLANTLFKLYI